MINLAAMYGDQIFRRKEAYKNAKILTYVFSLIIDLIVAFIIVKVFDIQWEYSILKVYAILIIFGFIKSILSWPIDWLNYILFIKEAMTSEINHYFHVFKILLHDDNSSTYDDYLLSAAFDNSIDKRLNILAAFTYAGIVNKYSTEPRMESMYYRAWIKAAEDFIKYNPDRVITTDGI